ncbi:sugar ABC transporter ATP-binding protein [Actinomyces sp. B33]|uniref:sugar ABC transporter ATP-binding protein n=1 Tax=Actinomyces sp. B33 TaxID=2942131 RepID=UPI002340FC67|nr:sugar ABC transporter ATP-binding protein [Actinomyces sp. B33]MDC4233835.1 sugar ABC transporter ATP-binding protein [Actinomyces sp. B33]
MDQQEHGGAPAPIAQMTGISIEFPGVKALDGVDFRLFPGEVHAIMGENGAGKSTLIKALTGVYQIDSGTILVEGKPQRFNGTAQAEAAGISTVYQEVNLCTNLSIGENLMLGHEVRSPLGINWKATHRQASEALGQVGLDHLDTRAPLASVSIAVQQLVAIARATVVNARVLILDEPTSSLDVSEVAQLFAIIRRLRDQGVAILFVSHFLDQVYEISDRITVLRNGRLIGEDLTVNLPRNVMVSMMIGQDLSNLDAIQSKRPEVADDAPVQLVAEELSRIGSVDAGSFDVRQGEVLGFAGLLGSGRTEAVRLVFGADRPDSGTLTLNGETIHAVGPLRSLAKGIAYSTENRRDEGIIAALSVRDNIMISLQAMRGWARRIPQAEQEEVCQRYITGLGIKTPSGDTPVGSLSGGNQQKVLLARWLATSPKVLMLDEPTRGIDVSAKSEIMKLVFDLAQDGMSIVFVSSEMDEVLRISNRIVVMRDRHQAALIDNDGTLTQKDIVGIIAEGGEQA